MSVTPSTLETPTDYAESLLDLCQELLTEAGDETADEKYQGGAIDRAYVGFGRAVVDCEQISVNWFGFGEQASATLPALLRHVYGRVNMLGFVVTVVRDCVPILNTAENGAPEVERVEASSRELTRDAWALWSGIYRAMRDGELFAGRCSALQMIRCEPLEPMGELAAFELQLAAEIDGIIASGGS